MLRWRNFKQTVSRKIRIIVGLMSYGEALHIRGSVEGD